MKTRQQRLLEEKATRPVIDLLSSDEDEAPIDRKPKARGKRDDSNGGGVGTCSSRQLSARRGRTAGENNNNIDTCDIEEEDKKIPAFASAVTISIEDSSSSSDESTCRRIRRRHRDKRRRKQSDDTDEEYARRLQQEEMELAKHSKTPTKSERKARKIQEKNDAALAATLLSQDESSREERKQKEMESMKESKAGRSVLLVENVIKLVEPYVSKGVETVGKDDAVYLAEQMIEMQEKFKKEGRPTEVYMGYHYTNSANLDSIRTDGLLTIEERQARKNTNTRNVAVFGNGIYTANNPLAFTQYGNVGLLVAVLKGKEENVGRPGGRTATADANTVVGNKLSVAPFYDEIILQASSQVLPLVKFEQAKISSSSYADIIWSLHQQVQHQVLDEYFNESVPTTVRRITSSGVTATVAGSLTKVATKKKRRSSRTPRSGSKSGGRAAKQSATALPAVVPAIGIGGASTVVPPLAYGIGSSVLIAGLGLLNRPAALLGFTSTSTAAVLPTGIPGAVPPVISIPSAVTGAASAAPAAFASRATRSRSRSRGRQSTSVVPPVSSIVEKIVYSAPNSMVGPRSVGFIPVAAPPAGTDCSICICPLVGSLSVVRLPHCRHEYHEDCINNSLKHDVKCPDCRTPITQSLQGKSPSGSMDVSLSSTDVAGFTGSGSIVINYQLKSGVQKSYQQNPGVKYGGSHRTAYLPNIPQGQDLVKRLKFAFRHGLTFTIGTSLTTHQPNSIVWGSIHHKTQVSGGTHGWPDANYFTNVNAELDALGVPAASQI